MGHIKASERDEMQLVKSRVLVWHLAQSYEQSVLTHGGTYQGDAAPSEANEEALAPKLRKREFCSAQILL